MKFLYWLGVIKHDFESILSSFHSAAALLESYSASKSNEAQDHLEAVDHFSSLADDAIAEANKAKAVAGKIKELLKP